MTKKQKKSLQQILIALALVILLKQMCIRDSLFPE